MIYTIQYNLENSNVNFSKYSQIGNKFGHINQRIGPISLTVYNNICFGCEKFLSEEKMFENVDGRRTESFEILLAHP